MNDKTFEDFFGRNSFRIMDLLDAEFPEVEISKYVWDIKQEEIEELQEENKKLLEEKEQWYLKYHKARSKMHRMKNYWNCAHHGKCSTKTILDGCNCPCDLWKIRELENDKPIVYYDEYGKVPDEVWDKKTLKQLEGEK